MQEVTSKLFEDDHWAYKRDKSCKLQVLQRYIPKTVKAANEIYDALKTNKFKSRGQYANRQDYTKTL